MLRPLTLLVIALGLPALPALAQSADARTSAVDAVQAFLGAMKAKDSAALSAGLHESARFTLLRPNPSGGHQVAVMSGAQFMGLVLNPTGPTFEELIRNPVVQVDGDLATVWVEYQVLLNGSLSHCGTDAFHLIRVGERWKLLNVSDTFRQQGCGEAWPTG